MYELGLKAEAFDHAHPAELTDLDSTLMDGLDPNESFDAEKLALNEQILTVAPKHGLDVLA